MKLKIKIILVLSLFVAAGLASVLWYTSRVEFRYGIKIEGVHLSANGYMLDFRYKVLDSDKALPLFDGKQNPYIIDLNTGAKFLVAAPPKLGAMRQTFRGTPPKEDRGYFIIFGNPWHYVKAGSKVAVVVGNFKSDEIIVQ